MIHVLTFATHAEGNFNNMINNNYGMKIKVLGWGKKWTGFRMKNEYIYNYIEKLNDDDIVIVLDGFDVHINGYLEDALKIFKKNNYKVLFSLNSKYNLFIDYSMNKIHNKNKNKYIANAGLYMGYIKYLKVFLNKSLNFKCNDDQRNINMLRNQYNFISIDKNNEIFFNANNLSNIKKSNAIFIQTPGLITFNRQKRVIFEYSQFFLEEISILLIIIFCLIIFNKNLNKKIKLILLLSLITILIIIFNKMDKSCI